MSELINISKKLTPYLKNKYILSILIFVVWVSVGAENNLLERAQYRTELKQLKKDKAYYLQQIEQDSKRLNELKTDKENLEKFAREQYMMKKDNEDVFVIVRD